MASVPPDEGFLANLFRGFGLVWGVGNIKDLRLPKTNSEFAPENRPFTCYQKEMNHLPTIHFQGRTC